MTLNEFMEQNSDVLPYIIYAEHKLIYKKCGHECNENNFLVSVTGYSRKLYIKCKQCSNKARRIRYENSKAVNLGVHKLFLVGVTKKPDKCELCGKITQNLVKDHKHGTNIFRGWICPVRCNMGIIGTIERLNIPIQKIVDYLNRVQ